MSFASGSKNFHAVDAPSGKRIWLILTVMAALLAIIGSGCAFMTGPKRSGKSYVINGKRYYILATADGYKEKGLASWYGKPFHGRKTASGEVYNMYEFSAAHKTLPLHTWVEVRNLKTKQRMFLRINDRGPFIDVRIIDLSQAAAIELGVHKPGVVPVLVIAVPKDQAKKLTARHKKAARKVDNTMAKREEEEDDD
ncbi:MAG: septal ring lytic transglycosylase RlpA family protein [Deltaproteobacteria bacterium]|jgi:rare lipoprotein A|nr:septal ring lytic transglycosylase RlpA family protein [Deltaproteobacteria bacterium]